MARQTEIQYVRYYTGGSAAPKVVPVYEEDPFYTPRVNKRKKKRVYMDPIAILATITAFVLGLSMFAGAHSLDKVRAERQSMDQYIGNLEMENARLRTEYQSGFNLEVVEKTALALGMVPRDQVETVSVRVLAPESQLSEQEPTLWEKVSTFFQELFA